MRHLLLILAFAVATSATHAAELLEIKLPDGQTTKGNLHLPANGLPTALVVFVHGTGPNTYENRRKVGNVEFKYYDMFGEEFANRGLAFFSYNRRGVEIGDEPPMFDNVDREAYKKASPASKWRHGPHHCHSKERQTSGEGQSDAAGLE